MKLKPLHDNVHMTRLEAAKKSSGGIVIPETAQDKRQRAKVVSVGPGRFDGGVFIPTTVKVGDVVLLPYMRGGDLVDNAKERPELVLAERELLGVIEAE